MDLMSDDVMMRRVVWYTWGLVDLFLFLFSHLQAGSLHRMAGMGWSNFVSTPSLAFSVPFFSSSSILLGFCCFWMVAFIKLLGFLRDGNGVSWCMGELDFPLVFFSWGLVLQISGGWGTSYDGYGSGWVPYCCILAVSFVLYHLLRTREMVVLG